MRSRPEYDAALLEDLAWLGFAADRGPDAPGGSRRARRHTRRRWRGFGRTDCCTAAIARARRSRSGRRRTAGRGRDRAVPAAVASAGSTGRRCGPRSAPAARRGWTRPSGRALGTSAPAGDPPIRDRDGNWTYAFSVVVDDLRQDIDLVIRGRDLIHATPTQIRLGRLLGRERQPTFLHHPLIRRPDGRKLSKSSGDTGVRELRDRPAETRGSGVARLDRGVKAIRVGDSRRQPGQRRTRRPANRKTATLDGQHRSGRPDRRTFGFSARRSSISQAWSRACQAIRRAA